MITGWQIRRALRRRAKELEAKHSQACHIACCMATDGHVHIVLATHKRLVEARALIVDWALFRVPVEGCAIQLQAIDRKIKRGKA